MKDQLDPALFHRITAALRTISSAVNTPEKKQPLLTRHVDYDGCVVVFGFPSHSPNTANIAKKFVIIMAFLKRALAKGPALHCTSHPEPFHPKPFEPQILNHKS